ncbi:MAG: hypothetical protein ACLT8R_07440 [Phascolarctobacterium sp.]|jgi:hypothetical protein
MKKEDYLELLDARLARYFDKKQLTAELPFTIIAEMNAADEGYFFLPSIKTYSVQHNEYLYAHSFAHKVQKEDLLPYLNYMKEKMQQLKTTTEHMSSVFALLIICENGMDEATLAEMQKYKYHKDYFLSLKGWSDLAIYVADLQQEKLYCNKIGRKTSQCFEFVPSK